ncbi:MAG: hypothetical protein ACI9FN_000764, partial [Saprospiraceae bacterium]
GLSKEALPGELVGCGSFTCGREFICRVFYFFSMNGKEIRRRHIQVKRRGISILR